MPVLLIIIDAGALYSITLLTALIGFVAKSNSQYIVLDMVTPIISIAFYMVILRVGLAQRPRNESSTLASFRRAPLPPSETSSRIRPMQVQIDQFTEVDHEISRKANEADSYEMSCV
jgi:hypothetical protein